MIESFTGELATGKIQSFYLPRKGVDFVVKYIALIVVLILSTVAVSVAVAVPLALQNPTGASAAIAAPENVFMFTLKSNDKDNFIMTTLADQRFVRLQVILELDKSFEPKDLKNPDRRMLLLQDSLLRTIRACRSEDLSAQNQNAFKKNLATTANQLLGKNAVRAVYLTSVTVQ